MAADFTGVDIYFCFLSGSFKFEDRAAVGGRVLNIEQGAIPSGTLVIVYVRVYGIFRVETVGQGNWLPNGYSFRRTGGDCTYGFPNTSEINATSEAVIKRKKGICDTLKGSGAEILWSVSKENDSKEKINLQTQRRVDIVMALDNASFVEAGEAAKDNDLYGAVLYGIG